MISVNETEIIGNILIEKYGGSKGFREITVLESALAGPFATFDGKDLYPDPIYKSSAVF